MTLADSLRKTLSIVGVFWAIKLFETLAGVSFSSFGIYPRDTEGLVGILSAPFLHGDFTHLISNSIPFIVLGTSILFFYPRIAREVILIIYIFTGLGVWLFARDSYHIGASGVVYGFAAFLFFCGIFRKDFKSVTVSLVVAFLYGGLIYGVLPLHPGVSFESHLIGALIGGICAYGFRNVREIDDDDEDEGYRHFNFHDEQDGYRNIESDRYKYNYRERNR